MTASRWIIAANPPPISNEIEAAQAARSPREAPPSAEIIVQYENDGSHGSSETRRKVTDRRDRWVVKLVFFGSIRY